MYIVLCIICMLLAGIFVASVSIKSERDGKTYTIFDNKHILVILGIGCFFGIGAFGVDKIDFWIVLIVAVIAFATGLVGRFIIGRNR